jgi:integral membrane protein
LKDLLHPVRVVRAAGLVDGVSLLVLLGIAMPLKYYADMPMAVTIVGTIHGYIVILYMLAILYAQLRLQWSALWSLLCLAAAFVPFAWFALDRAIKRRADRFEVKPIPVKWLVYAVVFFAFLDLFTQLPVMSTYASSLGASAAVAGFAVGMYSMTNLFGNIASGIWTDRRGAYPVVTAGLALTSGVLLLYGFVASPGALVAVRFLHGLVSGLIVPAAFTFLANVTEKDRQGSQSAVSGTFVGVAAIAGPAYSGIMASRTSVPFVFATVAALGLGLLLLTAIFLRKRDARSKDEKQRAAGRLVRNRELLQSFAGAFFLMFSQGALAYLLPLHVEALGYDSRISGTLLSMFGLIAVAVFIAQARVGFRRLPPVMRFSAGLAMMAASQILLGQSAGMTVLGAVMTLYGLGFALLFPAMNTLLIHGTTEANRGKAYGWFYALFSAGTVAGSSGIGLVPLSVQGQFAVTGCVMLVCVAAVLLTMPRVKVLAAKTGSDQGN